MINYMEKVSRSRDRRIMKLFLLRDGVKELKEKFQDAAELDCEILEYVTTYLYADHGFAGWWLRNRAHWDRFLFEAQWQLRVGGYEKSEEIEQAFFDTLVNDVLDYLECGSRDKFMEKKFYGKETR